ncbi:hypothetical protein MPSEU_001070800 [Mayamaea pseudoterrestris]|nr:hypothetical protein MPSEU_001070800 [Mayamaea pseudoterrestris]
MARTMCLVLFLALLFCCHSFQSQPSSSACASSSMPLRNDVQMQARTAASDAHDESISLESRAELSFIEEKVAAEIAQTLASFNAVNTSTAINRGPPAFRREVQLLQSLAESDDDLQQLQELWKIEKEPFAASITPLPKVHVDNDSFPRTIWQRYWIMSGEERRLLRQIRKHPHWADPRLRLAHLYLHENRNILQALEHCLVVLDVKPWHLELADLLVQLSLHRKDLGMALAWARLRFPKLVSIGSSNADTARRRKQRRKVWVERAISQAIQQLDAGEGNRERSRMAMSGLVISEEVWSRH